MTDTGPTQPLTNADERVLNRDLLWAPGTDAITESQMSAIRTRHSSAAQPIPSKTALGYDHLMAHADRAALLAEVDRLRAENARLRKQVQDYHKSASEHTAKFDRQHERLMEAQGRIDAARAIHQPVTVDWSASPKCKASHGPGWVNWPCPDAFALGMRAKDYNE